MRRLVAGSTLGLVAASIFLGCGASSTSPDCSNEFDRARWQKGGTAGEGRVDLAEEIERCDVVDGAGRAEARALLGDPSRPRGKARQRARVWLYYIGDSKEEYGPGHSRFLFVEFDARGRVVTAEVDPDRLHPGE